MNLRSDLYGLELTLAAAITSEGDEILVVEVSLDSIEIRFQVNGSSQAEGVRLGASRLREAVQVGLPVEGAE